MTLVQRQPVIHNNSTGEKILICMLWNRGVQHTTLLCMCVCVHVCACVCECLTRLGHCWHKFKNKNKKNYHATPFKLPNYKRVCYTTSQTVIDQPREILGFSKIVSANKFYDLSDKENQPKNCTHKNNVPSVGRRSVVSQNYINIHHTPLECNEMHAKERKRQSTNC